MRAKHCGNGVKRGGARTPNDVDVHRSKKGQSWKTKLTNMWYVDMTWDKSRRYLRDVGRFQFDFFCLGIFTPEKI